MKSRVRRIKVDLNFISVRFNQLDNETYAYFIANNCVEVNAPFSFPDSEASEEGSNGGINRFWLYL